MLFDSVLHRRTLPLGRMSGNCEKRGFTLMELMIYIAILGVIVLVAGRAFSDSTKFRVRTQNMLKASEVAEKVADMFSVDVSQMGAKVYKEAGSASVPDMFVASPKVYMDPSALVPDSSSFHLVQSANGETDTLKMRRLRYSSAGQADVVEEVAWFKRGKSLYRKCSVVEKIKAKTSSDCPDPSVVVEIASDIERFHVIPAQPGVVGDAFSTSAEKALVLPVVGAGVSGTPFRLLSRYASGHSGDEHFHFLSISPADGGEKINLTGFVSNYDREHNKPITTGKEVNQVFVGKAFTGVAPVDGSQWNILCSKVTLEPSVTYEISFELPYNADNSRLFCPGRDHAAVGFRHLDGTLVQDLDDFLFYVPATDYEPNLRSFRFSLKKQEKNVCLAFTFASYSPSSALGKVTIRNLKLRRVESANYNFDDKNYVPLVPDKKNVKAFLLELAVNRGGEKSNISLVVPVPSNGPRD